MRPFPSAVLKASRKQVRFEGRERVAFGWGLGGGVQPLEKRAHGVRGRGD